MIPILLAVLSLGAPPTEEGAAGAIHRLSVTPMAAPRPAMKYQLLPEVRELQPGNPVQWYLRCFAEQRNFFFSKEVAVERARFQTMPLKDLPADKLRNYGGSALSQADWGARLDTPDWQVLDRIQGEDTALTMPEIGPLRALAAALQVRFRVEVASGRFDDAIATAKTMLALARHLGEHPTSSANRLGLAVADMALETLEEMIQHPKCPNLYWALTDLPTPLVELRKGLQGDRAIVNTELRPFKDDTAMTGEEVEELVRRISGRSGFEREQGGLPPRNIRIMLAAKTKNEEYIAAARARLIEAGAKKDLVDRLPAMQVVFLDEKRECEHRRDEELKLAALPYWQIELTRKAGPQYDGLFAELLPQVVEVRRTQTLFEQRVAILRIVEALRIHAASNNGKFPAALDELKSPVPNDPVAGKAFTYSLNGTTARLRGAAPKGEEKNPAFNRIYEIAIQK